MSLERLLGSHANDFIPPALAVTRFAKLQEVFRLGQPLTFADERGGRVFLNYMYPVRDAAGVAVAVACISMDVTEQQRADEARRQAEGKYHNIFENAVEGIFQTTSEGRFLTLNPALARIHGYDSPAEMMAAVTNIGQQLHVDNALRA